MSSSKDLTSLVPIFNGADFRMWKERMSDFLGSQHLFGYASGTRTCPAGNTPADLITQADWDEVDHQVISLIVLRLSANLHTHLGATAALTWMSLENTFGTPHFTSVFKDFEEVLKIKLQVGHNPQVEIQRIWTILECLQANGCTLTNYIQGMILLHAIPAQWDNIASMYCNGMTQANVSFNDIRLAIMAEFEHTAHPLQIAHHADKISAVKRKGKSPQSKEQRNYSAPKPSAADAPSGSSSKKQRRGGKKEKARRAHAIVSSAFVPTSVLNHMQETHYLVAGSSSSRIEEVVEQIPAPTTGFTVVGGPSQCGPHQNCQFQLLRYYLLECSTSSSTICIRVKLKNSSP